MEASAGYLELRQMSAGRDSQAVVAPRWRRAAERLRLNRFSAAFRHGDARAIAATSPLQNRQFARAIGQIL